MRNLGRNTQWDGICHPTACLHVLDYSFLPGVRTIAFHQHTIFHEDLFPAGIFFRCAFLSCHNKTSTVVLLLYTTLEVYTKYGMVSHPNPIFSEDALQRIFEFSSGVPRLINRACTQALIYAYQNRRAIIDDRMVQIVLEGEVA